MLQRVAGAGSRNRNGTKGKKRGEKEINNETTGEQATNENVIVLRVPFSRLRARAVAR